MSAATSKLHVAADRMIVRATEAIRADRKANTPRRAHQADGAVARAMRALEIGEACKRIDAGGPLAMVRCMAQVETLETLLARGRSDAAAKLGRSYRTITDEEGVLYAHFPGLWLYADTVRRAGHDAEAAGAHEAAAVLLATAARSHDDVDLDSYLNRAARRMLTEHRGAKWLPWQWVEKAKERRHLEQMGIETTAQLRGVLAAWVATKRGAARPVDPTELRIRQLERSLVGARIPGYFPTPPAAAARLVELAGIEPMMDVLEPSAGKGDLAEAVRAAGGQVLAVERHLTLAKILQEKGFPTHVGDFLEVTPELAAFWKERPGFLFDRVVANPPFEDGADMTHVQHAFEFLKPYGRLAAIVSEGCFFRQDRQATAFRAWLEERGGTSEKLPAGTFERTDVTQRTGVATRIVVVERGTWGIDAEAWVRSLDEE